MSEPERLLKIAEAAHRLGISTTTCYEMTATGELPRVRIRSAVRVPESALARWISDHTECGPAS